MPLSRRGKAAIAQPLRADLDLFFSAMQNRYAAQTNPDGDFTLCVAENLLSWPEMESWLREIAARPIPAWVPAYTSITGAPELRQAATAFMTASLSGAAHDPERLAVAAGAAAVIEMTAFLLGDPEDVVVIPGPAYMAYTPDLGNRAQLRRYDLHPAASETNIPLTTRYTLTTEDLDRAYADLGEQFRVLLLTQPNNPTGQIYTPAQLTAFIDWCEQREIHLVSNEIYALSLLEQSHLELAPDYPEPATFTSILAQLEKRKSPFVHWWYAISKDFGLSGLRLGLAYTWNEDLLRAWGNHGAAAMASNHTQWLLSEIFRDQSRIDRYMIRSRQRLTHNYVMVVNLLRRHAIPYAPAAGSLFVWIDFSRLLTADTAAAELALWQKIYADTGILLTAPTGMGSPRRGWLRLVYSCLTPEELAVALQRLDAWLIATTG